MINRNETDNPTIHAIVAIISHHENMVGWNGPLFVPVRSHFLVDVGLIQKFAVAIHLIIFQLDLIPWLADHSLDPHMLIITADK
ncbi:hypothetical protein D3C86_1460710 [compost metagenome]